MNTEIKGIHLEINEKIREYVDKKLARLEFAKDLIVDCMLNLSREKNLYHIEVTVNFRWGHSVHIGVDGFDLFQGIDLLFDKLDAKVEKEKSKIKDHHRNQETAHTAKE
jgi:putative sigma-54 modulation protein